MAELAVVLATNEEVATPSALYNLFGSNVTKFAPHKALKLIA